MKDFTHSNSLNEEKNSLQKKTSAKKQKKLVDMEGFVTHNLSNGKFRLKLENGVEVIGHLSGKIRQNRIKIVVGDKVTVELSPYDLTKGRITYRHR
jgi:translation initiation factor IF-1